MKFLHLGDLHIGKSLGEFDLIPDQQYILNQILAIAEEQHVDAFLIAGDVYDKSIPSEAAVRLFDYFLCQLAERKIKTFVITGNHDSDERLNFGSSLFASSEIYISAKYNGTLYRQTLTDSEGEINVYLLPFVKASQVRHFFPDDEINNYEDAVKAVLKHAEIDPAKRNLLVAHQFVVGSGSSASAEKASASGSLAGLSAIDNAADLSAVTAEPVRTLPVLSGSESIGTQNVGLVEQIGSSCFTDFDYVALGHIHSAQKISRDEIRYSGSPLKYSLSEVHSEKSVPLITVGKKGEVSIDLIPLRPMRDLRHIRGRMDQLLARENIVDPEDFIYATLTDEEIINDAMGIFQQYYPNTIRIEYDNSHTRELQHADLTEITENKTFLELFSEFYQMVYGCKMSDDETALILEAAREAGVEDETD